MTGGYVFTGVCLFSFRGGGGRRVPPSQVWTGGQGRGWGGGAGWGTPFPVLDRGGGAEGTPFPRSVVFKLKLICFKQGEPKCYTV